MVLVKEKTYHQDGSRTTMEYELPIDDFIQMRTSLELVRINSTNTINTTNTTSTITSEDNTTSTTTNEDNTTSEDNTTNTDITDDTPLDEINELGLQHALDMLENIYRHHSQDARNHCARIARRHFRTIPNYILSNQYRIDFANFSIYYNSLRLGSTNTQPNTQPRLQTQVFSIPLGTTTTANANLTDVLTRITDIFGSFTNPPHTDEHITPEQLQENSEEFTVGDEDDFNDCSICLSNFESAQTAIKLNSCNHIFHKECIENWTLHNERRSTCPNCRTNIISSTENIVNTENTPSSPENPTDGDETDDSMPELDHEPTEVIDIAVEVEGSLDDLD